ncbi:MAG: outer membrane lipoprotein-sorting protein [Syntrophothermus sp.]
MIKKWLFVAAALSGSILLTSLWVALRVAAAPLTGDEIMARVDELIPHNGHYLTDLTMIRPGKDARTSRLQVFIKGSDKVFVRYLAPAQEKGQGYLRVGDDEWLYLPSANKSIRVSGKQSMQGSDLSNDDILKVRLTEDYSAKVIGEEEVDGKLNYVLELTAKSPAVTYGKLKYWVRRDDFLPSKTEYYAFSGKLLKTMTYSKVREIGGKVRPTVMEIESELKKGYKTIMTMVDADFDADISDSIFTRLYLEKGK